MPGRLLLAGDGECGWSLRSASALAPPSPPPGVPTPVAHPVHALSAPQIELLGYSGQFDYPEFLAEVRTQCV